MSFPQGIIVVTGAAGMIGSQIVRALADRGCRLVGCDHVSPEERADYLRGVQLEAWVQPALLPEWLECRAAEIGAIIHMGAISDTTETRLALLQTNNVRFSLNLWDLACRHDWRFLYASSAATYGNGEQGFFDSSAADYLSGLRPLNPYGWSKHGVDRAIARQVAEGADTPSVWAGFKFFNVYGPHEEHKGEMRSLVRKMVPTILAGEAVSLFRSHRPDIADGDQRRDFIHVKDAIAPVIAALARPHLAGLVNVGTGTARSFRDLALATFAALGVEPRIDYRDMPDAVRGQYQYWTSADTVRAERLGLQCASFSLEAGVADYVDWLLTARREQLHVAA